MSARARPLAPLLAIAGAILALAGCASAGASGDAASGKLQVVAAENFWGSIARELGGTKVSVRSVIANPGTDPHAYEPTAADAVALASSRLAIVNGIGYDTWASKLLDANPSSKRVVVDVGDVLGLKNGDNPHQWYSPASVRRVIDEITAGYKRLEPRAASYFDRARTRFLTAGLAPYQHLIAAIRTRYRGTPVGYSESVFEPLGRALALKLLTPPPFATAIAEGSDVTAADAQTVDAQAEGRQIKVWIYNSQNVTPDVQRVNQLARAAHIPITTLTETLSPASVTFERWQTDELRALASALHAATGR